MVYHMCINRKDEIACPKVNNPNLFRVFWEQALRKECVNRKRKNDRRYKKNPIGLDGKSCKVIGEEQLTHKKKIVRLLRGGVKQITL